MNTPLLLPLLTGALMLVTLTGYAIWLWLRIRQQQQQFDRTEALRQQRQASELRMLAESLLDGRMATIEGAIRIKILLDNHNLALSNHPNCLVFHQVFDATSGIPSLAARRALPGMQQRHDIRFSELELLHKAAVRKGARWLLDEALPQAPATS